MLIKIWGRIYYTWKKAGVQLIRREQRNDNNKFRSLILHLLTSGKKSNPNVYSIGWGKNESNLKLLKDKILQVKNFLLLNFVLFSYRERVISKHLTLVLAYVSIANNLKLTTVFLIMKSIKRKFQIQWNLYNIGTLKTGHLHKAESMSRNRLLCFSVKLSL